MEGVPDPRVGDREREAAANALREHFAAGRLDAGELDERLTAVLSARTESELAAVSTDLPGGALARRERRTLVARRTSAALTPFAICTTVWLAAGASGEFWPAWVLIAPVAVLMRGGSRPRPRRERARGRERRTRRR